MPQTSPLNWMMLTNALLVLISVSNIKTQPKSMKNSNNKISMKKSQKWMW